MYSMNDDCVYIRSFVTIDDDLGARPETSAMGAIP